jgi:multicomponent Na+:H+ antiporter subunit F
MSPPDLALAGLAVAFAISLIRAFKGPSVADRAVAADVGLCAVVAAIAILAVRAGSTAFIDVVLVATLLGFLATIALSSLVRRPPS